MRILHTMLRVGDLEKSLAFYTEVLGLTVLRRKDYPEGRFTLAFVGFGPESEQAAIELTHNWDTRSYEVGTGFGHVAIEVPNAYAACAQIKRRGGVVTREAGPMKHGTTVIAFVQDPDGYKVELIQQKQTDVPAPAELIAEKSVIEQQLQRLCDAAGVRTQQTTAQGLDLWGHLGEALRVLPHAELVTLLPRFEGSWLERYQCQVQGLTSRGRPGEKKVSPGNGLNTQERAMLTAGRVVLVNPKTLESIMLSPVGPDAQVVWAGHEELEVLGSVGTFVAREVRLIIEGP